MLKKIGIVILLAIIVGVGVGVYLWNKPAPKAENQDALKIEAQALFNDYTQNDKRADSLYLGKWLEVNGSVQSVDTNQDGQKILYLETGDMLSSIMCVMRDKTATGAQGEKLVVRGVCTGQTNGVVIKDCILIKK